MPAVETNKKPPKNRPRLIIAALRGGAGKTILSLGLTAAWREDGLKIAPFKKGPDFIDAGWLAFASGQTCHNLDPFLMKEDEVVRSFLTHSEGADISVIEGNRGLFDGLDLDGSCSTAELARLLKSPVLIVLDVTMATRTMAAVIKGCQAFDQDLDIAGVILNRVAGPRQETLVRESVERYCQIPVVGSVPKLKENLFPQRHMGLVPFQEQDHAEKAISWARATVRDNLQLDEIRRIAASAENFDRDLPDQRSPLMAVETHVKPRIGVIRDKSFWFYYPENLGQLECMGAVLVEIDSITDPGLPPIDALYIGGGFPETQARPLSDNESFRTDLREAIEKGLPVYAECGGLMYLGRKLIVEGREYPMAGAIPVDFILQKKPQGHGYTVLEVEGRNPYYPLGETLKGHEFHYSMAVMTGEEDVDFIFSVTRGHGVDGRRDGICKKNLLATYTHVHGAGNSQWARGLFKAALDYKKIMSIFPKR